MAVAAIMIIITTVVLFRQTKFNSSTVLRSLAYSVALSARQAQVYGTSVYASGTSFASAYGLYFDSSLKKSYILFSDLNGNGHYDVGEDVRVFSLSPSFNLSAFCLVNGANKVCSTDTLDSSGTARIDVLNVLFKRPNPDAQFYASLAGTPLGSFSFTNAYVQIQASDTTTRSITVSITGQIVVNPAIGTLP